MSESQDSATDLKLGTRVRSADGEFLGEVKEIQSDHYVIEKGRNLSGRLLHPENGDRKL